jgi:hypothetical protein
VCDGFRKADSWLFRYLQTLECSLSPLCNIFVPVLSSLQMLQLVRDDFETQRPMSEDARLAWRSALELTRRNRGPKVDEVFKCVVDCLVFLLHTRYVTCLPLSCLTTGTEVRVGLGRGGFCRRRV